MKSQHYASPVSSTQLRIPDLHSQPTQTKTSSVLGTSASMSSFSVTKSLIDKLLRYEGTLGARERRSVECSKSRKSKGKKPIRKSIQGLTSVQSTSTLNSDPAVPNTELGSSRIIRPSSIQKQSKALSESVSIKATPKAQVTHHFSEFASREQFSSQVLSLELQLTERLKRLHKTEDQPISYQSQFPLYSQVFQDIIDRDKKFGCLLMKVKSFYEEFLHSFMDSGRETAPKKMLEQCTSQLKAARLKLQENKEEKKLAHRKIEKLSKETMELARRLDESEQENVHLKAKLDEINSIDLSQMSQDAQVWKFLVMENQSYSCLCFQFQQDLKVAKEQEEALLELVQRMKDRGFPVEDLVQDLAQDIDEEEDSEGEPIVSGPAKMREKPGIVPRLRLEDIKKSPEEESRTFYPARPRTIQDHDQSTSFNQSGIDDFARFFKDKELDFQLEAVL